MHPYLLHRGHLYLPTFGVLAAVGLMAALGLSERTARRVRVPAEVLWDAGIVAILAAFLFSRALLVAANWPTFRSYPVLLLAVPSLSAAGLALAGGVTLLYLHARRISILAALDAWAPCATLVWGALALGHFSEGSDPGLATRGVFGLSSAGQYPVALYAAGAAFLLTLWLYRRLARTAHAGGTAAWALLWSGLAQFLLSFVREPGLQSFAGLDALEWVALGMMVAGGVLLAVPGPERTLVQPGQ